MLDTYFKYGKYLFLGFLIYSFYAIVQHNPDNLGLVELVLGFVFPAIPVWAAFHFFPLMTRDLKQSQLRFLTIASPLIVASIETYAIIGLSLSANYSPLGLLAAFGMGAIGFFILLCLILFLCLFARPNSQAVD